MTEVMKFFELIGLEKNKEKSATNCRALELEANFIDDRNCYKYLGVTEYSNSKPSQETIDKIKQKIFSRVDKLCKTNLNGKNLFLSINEYGISLINYYIGILDIEPEIFKDIDAQIRLILVKNGIHLQRACKERLYLSRKELGRGLCSLEFKSESML